MIHDALPFMVYRTQVTQELPGNKHAHPVREILLTATCQVSQIRDLFKSACTGNGQPWDARFDIPGAMEKRLANMEPQPGRRAGTREEAQQARPGSRRQLSLGQYAEPLAGGVADKQQANARSLAEIETALQLLKKLGVFCPFTRLEQACMSVRDQDKSWFCHCKQPAYFVMESKSSDHTKWAFCNKSLSLFGQKWEFFTIKSAAAVMCIPAS